MKRILRFLGAAGLALLASASIQAQLPVFATNPTGPWADGGIALTAGTPFIVGSSPVTVISLGYFDESGSGLTYAHEVGIYTLGKVLLGSVTVPSGTAADAYHDGTRWMNLATPINLAAYTYYTLAFTVTDSGDKANVALASQVTIDSHFALAGSGYTYTLGGSLTYPQTASGFGEYAFGGNMEIPEPQAWGICAAALAGLAACVIRRRAMAR